MALLEVRDLRVGYGFPVLMGISFDVEEGETAVLFGLNGAGKTTTVATIAGLLSPDSGSITFDGEQVGGLPAATLVQRRPSPKARRGECRTLVGPMPGKDARRSWGLGRRAPSGDPEPHRPIGEAVRSRAPSG